MTFRTINIDELIGWNDILTDEEQLVRLSVKKFVTTECMPNINENFKKDKFPIELIPKLSKLGLFGANLHGYGCAEMSSVAYGMACHELEACDSGLRSFVSVQTSLAMYSIHRFGSEIQKEKWLPKMVNGEIIGCFALTEPNHGSDPSRMTTKARKNGNSWILSGTKMWITNAQIADIAIIWAKTDEDIIQGFIVEKKFANFSCNNIENKLSLKASITGSLYLNDVVVPEENRIIKGVGLKAPLSCLNNARFSVAFGALGAAYNCLKYAIDYTKTRYQFGVLIAKKQLIQNKLAIMATEIAKAGLMSLHFAHLKDNGKLTTAHISMLKRNNCRIAIDIAREARTILGANGIISDYNVLRHALNLESTLTYEGTEEIHALIIGRYLTGEDAF